MQVFNLRRKVRKIQGRSLDVLDQLKGTRKQGNEKGMWWRDVEKEIKTTELKVTVSAHIPVKVARDYFGFNTTGLKPGVWAFGSASKGYDFVFTADVVDEFEDVVKLIAFPNCSNSTGFKFAIANGEEELAMMELEFTALPDELKNFYYEAFVDELADATVAQKWHTQFNSALVKGTPSA